MIENKENEELTVEDEFKEDAYYNAITDKGTLGISDSEKEKIKRCEFSSSTKKEAGFKAGFKCCFINPENGDVCGIDTICASSNSQGYSIFGEVGHIYGAKLTSKKSPRTDHNKTEDEVKSISNAIYLCRHHHKIVDSHVEDFTIEKLEKMRDDSYKLQINTVMEMQTKQAKKEKEQLEKQLHVAKEMMFSTDTCEKVTADFDDKSWCLFLYYYDCDNLLYSSSSELTFYDDYKNWFTKNNILTAKSGCSFNDYEDFKKNIEAICEKHNIFRLSDDGENLELLDRDDFDNICQDFFEFDNKFRDTNINRLKVKSYK